MAHFAQTNLQLYRQMMESSRYGENDVETVATAYAVAVPMFTGLYRGSGKPLIAHLVGTASIVAAIGRPTASVAAGLLHAAHADGDFGSTRETAQRHAILERRSSPEIAELLLRYEELGWSYDERTLEEIRAALPSMSSVDLEVVRLRIANELEDLLDDGILFCGSPGDDESRRKSAPWRVRYMRQHLPSLVELARDLQEPALAGWIAETSTAIEASHVPERLRTGQVAMHRIVSPSTRHRRDLARTARRRLDKVKELGPVETARVVARKLRRRLPI